MIPQIFSNTCPLNWALQYESYCMILHSYNWSTWLVTDTPNLSSRHLVTNIRHQHRCKQFWLLLECCLLFIVDGIIYSLTVELELRNSRKGAILNDQYRYKSVWLMFFYQDCIQILATYINKIQTSQKILWNNESGRLCPIEPVRTVYLGNETWQTDWVWWVENVIDLKLKLQMFGIGM